jgi:hypothetical protein
MSNSGAEVPEDSEVGSNIQFEHNWWKTETIISGVLSLFVLLGLLGAFGQGPLSKVKAQQDGFTSEYERFTRYRTPTEIVVRLPKEALQAGHVEIWMSGSLLDGARMSNVIPKPDHTTLKSDGIVFDFTTDVTTDKAHVVFVQEPTKAGKISGQISASGHNWNISSFVYP